VIEVFANRRGALSVAAVAVSALCVVLSGCGGGSSSATSGSIPVKTITGTPSYTVPFRVPSSSMEPTLHCAKPAPGCEANAADYVVAEGPVHDAKRGEVVAFQTPSAAAPRCGEGGVFIKRVIGLPGETVREDSHGFVTSTARSSMSRTFRLRGGSPTRRTSIAVGMCPQVTTS
jgi:hypothetical protein